MWEKMWNGGGNVLKPGSAFDTGGPCKALVALLQKRAAALHPRNWATALVPGGGRGYDAFAIAQSGLVGSVTQLDLSPTATAAAAQWVAERTKEEQKELAITCTAGDFFALQKADARFDLIFDCTFLCALDPSVRSDWAKTHSSLLRNSDSELWTLIFPIVPDSGAGARPGHKSYQALTEQPGAGPPYAMSFELVQGLLAQQGLELAHREECSEDTAHMAQNPFGATTVLACWRRTPAGPGK